MKSLAETWREEIDQVLSKIYGSLAWGYTKAGEPFLPQRRHRERHSLTLGAPGSGKTRLLSLIARSHIEQGHTLIILDPHGTKPDSLYQLVLADALDLGLEGELILLDPSAPPQGYVLSWNPTSRNGLPVPTQAEYLLEAVNKACKDFLSEEQRPQHERWLLNILEYLIYENRPLLDSLEILRGEGLLEIEESEILATELDYYYRQTPKRREELTESIFNRLRRILSSPALQETFSQREGRFHLTELIKEPGKIILTNLGSSPRLSRRASTLLGSLLLAELVMALELRGAREPQVAVICDEASRFITPDLGIAFAELRGYGCSMTLAAQSLSQLADEERKTLETCMACSETIIAFRLSFEDAERLARGFLKFEPHLIKDEIFQTKYEPYISPITTSTSSRSQSYLEDEPDIVRITETEATNTGYITEHLAFEELTSRTFYSLEEQIRMLAEEIRDLPDREAILKDSRQLQRLRVAEVPDAEFSQEELRALYRRLFEGSEYYVKIEEIKAERARTKGFENPEEF